MTQLAEQDTEEQQKYIWHFLQGVGLNYTIGDNPEKQKKGRIKKNVGAKLSLQQLQLSIEPFTQQEARSPLATITLSDLAGK